MVNSIPETRDQASLWPFISEVIAKYERKMQLIPQDMENIRKTQMSERRQHWDGQMASLIEDHDRAVRDWDVVIAQIKQDADLNLSLKVFHVETDPISYLGNDYKACFNPKTISLMSVNK